MDKVQGWAWPLVVLAAILMFREPLRAFLSAAGGRVSKFKIFNLEVELATSAGSGKLLHELHAPVAAADFNSVANLDQLNESASELTAQLQLTDPADYALINLGQGEEWIVSRLYLAAVLMQRMRRLKAFVFVEQAQGVERRFVALASVSEARWALAKKYPWLEAAWVRANLSVFGIYQGPDASWIPDPRTYNSVPSPFTSDSGAVDPWRVFELFRHYLTCLQEPKPPNGETRPEWTDLENGVSERGEAVTTKNLKSLLPAAAFEAWAPDLRDEARARQTRAVLRRKGDFVALVFPDRRLSAVANRRAILEDLAKDESAEPEA